MPRPGSLFWTSRLVAVTPLPIWTSWMWLSMQAAMSPMPLSLSSSSNGAGGSRRGRQRRGQRGCAAGGLAGAHAAAPEVLEPQPGFRFGRKLADWGRDDGDEESGFSAAAGPGGAGVPASADGEDAEMQEAIRRSLMDAQGAQLCQCCLALPLVLAGSSLSAKDAPSEQVQGWPREGTAAMMRASWCGRQRLALVRARQRTPALRRQERGPWQQP